jgi:hypothetical protein
MRTTKSALTAAVLVTLSSCGGGGGGGSSAPVVPTTPIALTLTNAVAVAGGATLAGLGAASAGTFFELAFKPDQVRPRTHVLTQILRQAVQLISAAGTTTPCNVSGNSTVTQTGVNSASIIFNACSDVTGEVLNGEIDIANIDINTGVSFSGTASVGLTLKQTGLPDFSISGSSISVSDQVVSPTADTVTMTGSAISTVSGTTAERLGTYTFVSAFDDTAQAETDTVTFDYASTAIGGQVHVTTFTAPVTTFASDVPRSGALTITGTQSSVMRVNINGDANSLPPQVNVLVDTNGDGTIEQNFGVSWTDLGF